MKLLERYRDPGSVLKLAGEISEITTKPWTLMEVCGGQTHTIVKYGLDTLLPSKIRLVHGPGCPVCVTPAGWIDKAREICLSGAVVCSFGDMLRVPGHTGDLLSAKALGGKVSIVYSPLDALALAEKHPEKEIVFFAVGFETTAPATAMAALQAKARGLRNFSLLVCHVLVPPAMEAVLGSPDSEVQGFLAAGHVCAVMGMEEYEPLARRYRVPIVVTGFEPLDIMEGIRLCVSQLEAGEARVENQYVRAVDRAGNLDAQRCIREVFEVTARQWRGLGALPRSGLGLRPAFRELDAETRYGAVNEQGEVSPECISGLVLQGLKVPAECPAFGKRCTPETPLGAPMVSSEGACAAYYRYRGGPANER